MIYVQYFATSFIHVVPILLLISFVLVDIFRSKENKYKKAYISGTDDEGIERIKCNHDFNLTGLCIKEEGNCKTFGECSRRCNK